MASHNYAKCGYNARMVSIELPEDQLCDRPDRNGHCNCAIRTGGDSLEGEVSFQTALSDSVVIDVCFEGFSRTWVPRSGSTAPYVNEHHFLQQVETIEYRVPPEDRPISWPKSCTAPFRFKIPTWLPVASELSSTDPRLQALYPSMTAGKGYKEHLDGKLYMQPSIFYKLSASARMSGVESQRPRTGIAREIIIMPTTVCPPPTYPHDYEDENTLKATCDIRKHFYSRSQGSFDLMAEEPQPIAVPGPYGRSATTLYLKGSYKKGRKVSERTVEPYNWVFKVRTRLRRRLFYATKPMEQEPTVADARVNSHVGLRTKILQSEERECSELIWRNDHISSCGTIVPGDAEASVWNVIIPMNISTEHTLIPSFFSATVALRYSILLDVRVLGLWSGDISLEVPLQVIYHSRAVFKDSLLSIQLSCLCDEDEGVEDMFEPRMQPPKYRRWAY